MPAKPYKANKMAPVNINALNDKPDSPSGVVVMANYPTVKPASGNGGKGKGGSMTAVDIYALSDTPDHAGGLPLDKTI